jgi:euchromatic histone-lysine N-methyltransferase
VLVDLPLMEAMDSVAVMEVAAVPDPVFVGAAPLTPPPEASVLRRSARCLNRPRAPIYTEKEEPKQPTGRRGRPKKKRDAENHDPAAEAQVQAKVARKAPKAEPKEKKPMPVVEPISAADFAGAAAEDDALGKGKSAKLRVKETLRAFNSHYLHLVQVGGLMCLNFCLLVSLLYLVLSDLLRVCLCLSGCRKSRRELRL